jgi:hypothetical protein
MNKLPGALRLLADEGVAPPLPPDLWRRGMRRHRRRRAVGVAAAVLVLVAVLTPVTLDGGDAESARPADTGPAIPSRVHPPWPGQAQVTDLPAGRAALIVTGSGSLRSNDFADSYEGRTMVVARDGRYRLVDGQNEGDAGTDMLLSPDGRRLAVAGPVEGADHVSPEETSLIDLTTGKVTRVRGGRPIGWAPDSRHLLVYAVDGHRITRYDTATGSGRELSRLTGTIPVPPYVTFTPDAFRFIVITGSGHRRYDETDETDVGLRFREVAGFRLAGPAAMNPDGRLAYWRTVSGCTLSCADLSEPVGEFRLVLGDRDGPPSYPADTGGRADRTSEFEHVTGWMPRLLGWLPDGSAVVEVVEPTGRAVGPAARARVIAMKPGGGRTVLITLPSDAHRVELARGLVATGRFGADPPSAPARTVDWLRGLLPMLLVTAVVVVVAVVGVRRWRVRRAASGHPPTA